jgi:DNA-binding protein YbaB
MNEAIRAAIKSAIHKLAEQVEKEIKKLTGK